MAIAHVAIGVIGGATKHREAAVFLAVLHDAVIGNIAHQQVSTFGEVGWPLCPPHSRRDLFDRAAINAVLGKAGVEDQHRRIGVTLIRFELKRLRSRLRTEGGQSSARREVQKVSALGCDRLFYYCIFCNCRLEELTSSATL